MGKNIQDSIADQVRAVRDTAGAWIREDHTLIRFEGKDAASWLQTQTSNDVLALQSGDGHAGTLLDRKGKLQAHFTLHRWDNECWMLIERQQAPRLIEQLDAHLFLEDVRMEDAGAEVEQVAIQGPRTAAFLAALLDRDGVVASERLPVNPWGCHPLVLAGFEVLAFRLSLAGEDGYVLITQTGEARLLLDTLLAQQTPFPIGEIERPAREVLRIEAGIPRFGADMDTSNRMPETTLERDAVSYDKGCYLGQEVVAKLRAYSSVKHALIGLVFENAADRWPKTGEPILIEGKNVGVVKSGCFSPTLEAPITLAYLDRDHRAPGHRLSFTCESNGKLWQARVVVLPFYSAPTRQERARALYDAALARFEEDTHDEDTSAIDLLKESVLLDPTFEDAYEALGVILNRHHRVDEAIYYMKILERLNPDSIMAHTNLSVFYVAQGLIEAAEEEKAKAAVLQMRHARDAHRAEAMAAEERERIRNEARERIGMFREVLAIDPDDPLATFGMGMAHVQLGEYAEALPYLERATQLQKDYSVAYLNLGKCREFLNDAYGAAAAYRAGLEAAGRKGDLMPLREMERRLSALENQGTRTEAPGK